MEPTNFDYGYLIIAAVILLFAAVGFLRVKNTPPQNRKPDETTARIRYMQTLIHDDETVIF